MTDAAYRFTDPGDLRTLAVLFADNPFALWVSEVVRPVIGEVAWAAMLTLVVRWQSAEREMYDVAGPLREMHEKRRRTPCGRCQSFAQRMPEVFAFVQAVVEGRAYLQGLVSQADEARGEQLAEAAGNAPPA